MSAYGPHTGLDPAEPGRRLRAARLAAGLSQRRLAFPGCSAAQISRFERGEAHPSGEVLRALAERLGVEVRELGGAERPAALAEAELAVRLGRNEQARALYERALKTSTGPGARAEALAGLGRLALLRGDPGQAASAIAEALALAPELGERAPDLLRTLGRAHAESGGLEAAVAVLERGAAAAAKRGDELERTRCEVTLANAWIDLGEFGRAGGLLAAAHARSAAADPVVRSRITWSQARLHTLSGDQPAAARSAEETLALLELTEDAFNRGRVHQLLAFIAVERGRGEEALAWVERGLAALGESARPIELAQFRLEEARALLLLGRPGEAAAAAIAVPGLLRDAEPDDAGRAYTVLGDVHRQLGDQARALEIWELAAELLERETNPYVAEVYERLARLFEEQGRTEEALELLKRALGARPRTRAH